MREKESPEVNRLDMVQVGGPFRRPLLALGLGVGDVEMRCLFSV